MSDEVERFLVRLGARVDLPAAERERFLTGLRAHLRERVAARRSTTSEEPEENAQHAVIRALGDPDGLAVRRDGGALELVNKEGGVLYRARPLRGAVRPAPPPSAGRSRVPLIASVVSVAVILLCAGLLTLVLFDDVVEIVRGTERDLAHATSDDCRHGCVTASARVKAFHVDEGARSVVLYLQARSAEEGNGTALVRVLDPDGRVLYARSFESGSGTVQTDRALWPPTTGSWRVETSYDGFAGSLRLDVYVSGATR